MFDFSGFDMLRDASNITVIASMVTLTVMVALTVTAWGSKLLYNVALATSFVVIIGCGALLWSGYSQAAAADESIAEELAKAVGVDEFVSSTPLKDIYYGLLDSKSEYSLDYATIVSGDESFYIPVEWTLEGDEGLVSVGVRSPSGEVSPLTVENAEKFQESKLK